MQPNQPIDTNQGQPVPDVGSSSAISPVMMMNLLRQLQPFIQKMVVMEVQKALQGEQGQDQGVPQGPTDPNMGGQ